PAKGRRRGNLAQGNLEEVSRSRGHRLVAGRVDRARSLRRRSSSVAGMRPRSSTSRPPSSDCRSDRRFMFRLGLVLFVTAAATIAGWRLLDHHVQAANVEGPLHGVTYAPWAKDQDPLSGKSSGIVSFLRTAFTE